MKQFALWLSATSPSVYIQEHNSWTIPAIQSIHIVGIALVMGSVLMIDLRILGWAWVDQTLRQTTDRFGPWLTGALWLLLVTGILMVIGEPVRELVTLSFWLKMALVAIGAAVAILFQRALRRHEQHWEDTLVHTRSIKSAAILTLLIWVCIIFLGRLIAYDHVWGKLVTIGAAVVDIASLLEWLQQTGLAVHIRDSLFAFPLIESTHVIGLTLVLGTIAIIDLRLLGLASTNRPFQRLAADTLKWTWMAFVVSAITGSLMFMTNATVYYHNAYFRAKIALLALAAINMLVFEVTTRRSVAQWDRDASAPLLGRAVAAVSLVIWISVIVTGRMIGFTTTRASLAEPAPVEQSLEELLGLPGDGAPSAPTEESK